MYKLFIYINFILILVSCLSTKKLCLSSREVTKDIVNVKDETKYGYVSDSIPASSIIELGTIDFNLNFEFVNLDTNKKSLYFKGFERDSVPLKFLVGEVDNGNLIIREMLFTANMYGHFEFKISNISNLDVLIVCFPGYFTEVYHIGKLLK